MENTVQIVNKELKLQTNAIAKLVKRTAVATAEIAFRLAYIKSNIDVTDEGFKNISDYAEQVFGFKKSTTYNYIRVAERYIEKRGNKYESIIAMPEDTPECKDYTVSQLIELLPIDNTIACELHDNGEISPNMSANKIRKVIKGITEKQEAEEAEAEEAEAEEAEAEEAEEFTETEDADLFNGDVTEAFIEHVFKTIEQCFVDFDGNESLYATTEYRLGVAKMVKVGFNIFEASIDRYNCDTFIISIRTDSDAPVITHEFTFNHS